MWAEAACSLRTCTRVHQLYSMQPVTYLHIFEFLLLSRLIFRTPPPQ